MSLYVLESPWDLFFFLNLSWNVLNFYDDCPGKSTENVLECIWKSWNLKKNFEWAPCNTITNPNDTVNTFNNYFASIAGTSKNNLKYSHKHFSDYLTEECESTIFLKPTSKEEIYNIISSLNFNTASGPKSIPYIEFYFFIKIKFQCNWQICSTFLLWPVFFHWYSKLQR